MASGEVCRRRPSMAGPKGETVKVRVYTDR
jgi:hypothetical protein